MHQSPLPQHLQMLDDNCDDRGREQAKEYKLFLNVSLNDTVNC